MPCSFCREDCRDSGGRFASTASILCRKTPGGGTAARFSMQFARAARPGGPGCRPCGCGWQPARASRPWRSGFLPPLQLRAAAGVRRGFPLRLLRVSLPCSLAFGVVRRPSKGRVWAGASRARKSAVSGQQSAFWHGASPSWGAPERFHREPNSPTWAFPGRGHPPASREGGVACQSAVSWPKIGDFRARSGACSDGASLSVALESAEKGARFKRKDGEGRSPRTEGRGGALALSEGAGRGRARARLRVGVRGETRRRLRRLPGCALRCGGLSPRPAEGHASRCDGRLRHRSRGCHLGAIWGVSAVVGKRAGTGSDRSQSGV